MWLYFLVAAGQSSEPAADFQLLTHPLMLLAAESWPVAWNSVLTVAKQQQTSLIGWRWRQFQNCFVWMGMNGHKPILYKLLLPNVHTWLIAPNAQVCQRKGRKYTQHLAVETCHLHIFCKVFFCHQTWQKICFWSLLYAHFFCLPICKGASMVQKHQQLKLYAVLDILYKNKS